MLLSVVECVGWSPQLQKSHHNPKKSKKVKMPSQCVECNITYKDHKSLLRHQKTKHGDVLQFNCEKCPFTSNRKDNLTKHFKKYHIQSYKGKKRKRNQHGARSVLLSEIPQLVEDSESEDDDDDESENEDNNLETHPPEKNLTSNLKRRKKLQWISTQLKFLSSVRNAHTDQYTEKNLKTTSELLTK